MILMGEKPFLKINLFELMIVNLMDHNLVKK